jgi:hypothetical protein
MNPYDELGVSRTASLREIRTAYRKRAKTCHPDTGGDPATFARLKLAYDILIDPKRRQAFDATGDASEATPDNTQAEVLAHLSVVLQTVVAERHNQISQIDLIGEMAARLHANAATFRTEIRQMHTTMAVWALAAGRIVVKRGKPNTLAELCRSTVKSLEQRVQEHERRIATIERAIAMLKDFSYKRDPRTNTVEMPASILNSTFAFRPFS